jgi:hypothetical protein
VSSAGIRAGIESKIRAHTRKVLYATSRFCALRVRLDAPLLSRRGKDTCARHMAEYCDPFEARVAGRSEAGGRPPCSPTKADQRATAGGLKNGYSLNGATVSRVIHLTCWTAYSSSFCSSRAPPRWMIERSGSASGLSPRARAGSSSHRSSAVSQIISDRCDQPTLPGKSVTARSAARSLQPRAPSLKGHSRRTQPTGGCARPHVHSRASICRRLCRTTPMASVAGVVADRAPRGRKCGDGAKDGLAFQSHDGFRRRGQHLSAILRRRFPSERVRAW